MKAAPWAVGFAVLAGCQNTQMVVGKWKAEGGSDLPDTTLAIEFKPDGTFRSDSESWSGSGQTVQTLWGTWTLEGDTLVLEHKKVGWAFPGDKRREERLRRERSEADRQVLEMADLNGRWKLEWHNESQFAVSLPMGRFLWKRQ
ncbi:MAG: hypothetical protein KIT11_03225 [Fimbriimonadaceae bacterium]|nr:hypothetical protein [Fimbriimonadaceae bacterium]QYK57091.1 MAG: hypothetical protein KF733_06300 [Fimbriimonadaceae bacterium]